MARGMLRVAILSVAAVVAGVLVLFIAMIAAAGLAANGIVSVETAYVLVFLPFTLVMLGGGFWISVLWMRTIDEAAREAHKSAWFWGGSIGMSVGLLLVLMSMWWPGVETLNLPGLDGRDDPAAHMAMGAILMVLIMGAGYVVAWIVWWLQRR